MQKWQSKQKKKGLCIECTNPAKGQRCDKCNKRRADKKKVNYSLWKENNKCFRCGNPLLSGKYNCLPCYLRGISGKALGKQKYWKELIILMEKQNFKCALTGDKISFEHDIELDHILPTTRNGKNELSNVRWVTKEANRLKQNLTDKELKILCNKILITI